MLNCIFFFFFEQYSQQFVVGSPASKIAQQRLDDVLEHLYEHYTSTYSKIGRSDQAMTSFEESSVRSLAQQLGVWPQTAVRKFDKLELKLRRSRITAIQEYQEHLEHMENEGTRNSDNGVPTDENDFFSENVGFDTSQGEGRSGIVGETNWNEDVVVTLPPMGQRRTSTTSSSSSNSVTPTTLEQQHKGEVLGDSSRMSLMSIDGDALDL